MKHIRYGVLIPLLLLLIYTPWSAELDLWTSRQFYQDGHFASSRFLDFIFHEGIWPAWILVGIASVGLIVSFLNPIKRHWSASCLYLLLTFAIGSGVVIHAIFKEHWGRPRPKNTVVNSVADTAVPSLFSSKF